MTKFSKLGRDRVLTYVLHGFEGASTIQFVFMVFVFILYLAGNLHNLADDAMFLLLDLLRILGITAALVNMVTLVLIIVWGLRHGLMLWVRFFMSLVSFVLGLVLTFAMVLVYGFITPV